VTGYSAASTPLPDLKTLQRKLADNRQEVRNLQVMQMRPGQSTEKLELLHNLERSARASAKLRRKAIQYWWSIQKVKRHRKVKRRSDPHLLDLFDRHCASQRRALPPFPKLVISSPVEPSRDSHMDVFNKAAKKTLDLTAEFARVRLRAARVKARHLATQRKTRRGKQRLRSNGGSGRRIGRRRLNARLRTPAKLTAPISG
jgi:hypothetical protein